METTDDHAARFFAKVDTSGECWLWTGALGYDGYGRFHDGGATKLAHRVAYELLVGPIPDGLDLDHVKANGCTSRACVRAPDHLEPVTHRENLRRGRNASREKTHCPRGHPYDRVYSGARHCSICRNELLRARRLRARLGTGGK